MGLIRKSLAVGATAVAVVAGTTVAAEATAYQTTLSWGSHVRMEVIFDNAGSETYFVRDAYVDSYGAYSTWWSGSKSGNCNDTNGGGSTFVSCGPLYLGEGNAFDVNLCSKDYDGGSLRDQKCSGRFRLGTA